MSKLVVNLETSLQAMVTHVDGLISRMPHHRKEWSTKGLQAAWRLGQWDLLEEYVSGANADCSSSNTAPDGNFAFDLSLAKVLQALQKKDQDLLAEELLHSRQTLLAPLAAASMESYNRAYPYIVKLHMLRELEDFSTVTAAVDSSDGSCKPNGGGPEQDLPTVSMVKFVGDLDSRLKITQVEILSSSGGETAAECLVADQSL
jgi:serine/threonine-protein kinase ATR